MQLILKEWAGEGMWSKVLQKVLHGHFLLVQASSILYDLCRLQTIEWWQWLLSCFERVHRNKDAPYATAQRSRNERRKTSRMWMLTETALWTAWNFWFWCAAAMTFEMRVCLGHAKINWRHLLRMVRHQSTTIQFVVRPAHDVSVQKDFRMFGPQFLNAHTLA